VKGKRVVVVDDSIVRGTTCKARVNNLKEAGAKEVHVLVSCPPHMNPCVYGIDFPDRSKLMAANNTVDEIRKYLNADSLGYLVRGGHGAPPPACPRNPFAWPVTTANIPCPTTRWWTSTSSNAAAQPAPFYHQQWPAVFPGWTGCRLELHQ
jgi:amidophosphoribosyltransferase